MLKTRLVMVILLGLLMLGMVMPVAAQTPVPNPFETPMATVVPTPGPDISTSELPLAERALSFVLGALTGAILGVSAILGAIGRFKNDLATLNMIEHLARGISPEALNQLNEMGRNLRDAGTVIDKVTDMQPNEAFVTGRPRDAEGNPWEPPHKNESGEFVGGSAPIFKPTSPPSQTGDLG